MAAILPSMRKLNYLSNKSLLEQIWHSKLSYTEIFDPDASAAFERGLVAPILNPDVVTDDLETVTEPGLTVRLTTDDHVPKAEVITGKGKLSHLAGDISFEPFRLYRSETGHNSGAVTFREIARSHSRNGSFSPNHGQFTPTLGLQLTMLIERYALRGNWRNYTYQDEMQSAALVNLMQNALKFNEAKGSNPFAYFTQLCTNSFIRVHNKEAAHRAHRDDMLQDAGVLPSMTRQLAHLPSSATGGEVRHLLKADPARLAAVQAYRETTMRSTRRNRPTV
jgi:hypothetical protein